MMHEEILKAKKDFEVLNRQLGNALTVRVNEHREKIEEKMTRLEVTLSARVEKEIAQHFQVILRKVTDLTRMMDTYQKSTSGAMEHLRREFRDKAAVLDRLVKEIQAERHKALRD